MPGPRRRPLDRSSAVLLAGLAIALCACGCSAFRPIEGIPAGALSDAYRMPVRSGKTTIDLSLLGQSPPAEHRVDAEDVLGIYIDGVLGADVETPPVAVVSAAGVRPSLGYPVEVEGDGTITLPWIGPIPVRGLTLGEARERLREAYSEMLTPRARVLVTLQKPRTYDVLVIRQEDGADTGVDQLLRQAPSDIVRRGLGQIVELPAYQNDVLHALTATGGMPALDAENAVYVIRQSPPMAPPAGTAEAAGPPWGGHTPTPFPQSDAVWAGTPAVPQIVRIPLRIHPGEPLCFSPADMLLASGDVVYIESRTCDFFYTSGLFGGGQYQLPRDYDLDVLGAVAIVQGRQNDGGITKSVGGRSALNKDVTVGASQLVILRPQPNGSMLPIEVDLYEAVHDPRQRVLIRPGDHLILQYSRSEACAAFVERHLLEGMVLGIASSLFYSR